MKVLRLLFALSILAGVWYLAAKPYIDHRAERPDEAFELPWKWGMDFNGGVQLVYQLRADKVKALELSEKELNERMETSRERLRERILAFHTAESKIAILGENRILVEVPGAKDIEDVKRQVGKPQYLTIRGVLEDSPHLETAEGWFPHGEGSVKLTEPRVRGEHIEFNKFEPVERLEQGRHGFVLPLNDEGQELCSEFTTQFAQKEIAIVMDDEVRDVLYVQEGGLRTPLITCGDRMDAVRLRKLLKSGPLPLPFELVQEKHVSPILAAMQQTSLQALSMGVLLLVLFFTINYLHRPYFLLVATMAVALEVGLFGIIANKGWVVISLPQLAGLALLIGMSVDAFILVFEHIERSMAEDSEGLEDALSVARAAFKTEIGVIFWASMTTVLSLGGLFFVEGVLGEYFVLLALGVGISLSAALYLRLLMGTDLLVNATQWASREKPFAPWLPWMRQVDLMALAPKFTLGYKIAVPAALLAIAVCVGAGLVNLGIDFSGGAQIVLESDKELDSEELRKISDDLFDARCEVQFTRDGGAGGNALHYTVRIPELLEDMTQADAGIAAVASGASGPRRPKVLESELLAKVESELGAKAEIVEVELLGSAAALDNTFSSMQNAAWGVLVLFVLCAMLYISLRVPFWIVVALTVDVILVLGMILTLGVPIDYPMIAAFLTFAGYSINDSIVVCHEIRQLGKSHMPEMVRASDPKLPELILHAIGLGLRPLSSRVMLTSITTMLTMVPLLFCDGVLRTFGVIFVLGVAVGTLSSVYIVGLHARDVVMGDTQVIE